jgi:hypothetical protein
MKNPIIQKLNICFYSKSITKNQWNNLYKIVIMFGATPKWNISYPFDKTKKCGNFVVLFQKGVHVCVFVCVCVCVCVCQRASFLLVSKLFYTQIIWNAFFIILFSEADCIDFWGYVLPGLPKHNSFKTSFCQFQIFVTFSVCNFS